MFVNDRREYIDTMGYRLSPMLCDCKLKDLCGRVGACKIPKPLYIPAKGSRKPYAIFSQHMITHDSVKREALC